MKKLSEKDFSIISLYCDNCLQTISVEEVCRISECLTVLSYSHCLLSFVVTFQYLSGFGSEFATADPRCPEALPEGQVNLNKNSERILFVTSLKNVY